MWGVKPAVELKEEGLLAPLTGTNSTVTLWQPPKSGEITITTMRTSTLSCLIRTVIRYNSKVSAT